MDEHTLWNLIHEAWAALRPHFMPTFERFSAERGLDIPTWGLLLAALTLDPITPSRLEVRDPYTAADAYLARLAPLAEKGYLVEVAPGEYSLTDTGRAEVHRSIKEVRAAMAEADPLPLADSERLAGLLDRLVQASLATPPPLDTLRLRSGQAWSISLSHRLMPAASPALPYIEQAISCLAAHRDDAHLAAWQPSGLSATALEALTFLWRSEADSLDALCERLAHRGHPRQVYAQALAELREQGLIEGPDSAPWVTEAGRAFRDQVEADTDRYFFAPWTCLEDADKAELTDLLTRLRDGLKESTP